MPTITRTSTNAVTKVALGVAIAASAAFAMVSLKEVFTDKKMKDAPVYSSGAGKVSPGYQVGSQDYCINKCFVAFSLCSDAGRGLPVCDAEFVSCRDACVVSAPGYVPPGYVPPGYVPPGYVPPGYVWPGKIQQEQPKKK